MCMAFEKLDLVVIFSFQAEQGRTLIATNLYEQDCCTDTSVVTQPARALRYQLDMWTCGCIL